MGTWRVAVVVVALVFALPAQCDLTQWPADPIAALAELPLRPAVAGGNDITVWRDQQPAAGADVFVVADDCVDFATHSFLTLRSSDQTMLVATLASRFGVHYRTGEDGTVAVALPPRACFCLAVVGMQLGSTLANPGGKSRIRLHTYGEVAVEVLDAEGRPRPEVEVDLGQIRGDTFGPLASARTGRGGRARILTPRPQGGEFEVRAALVSSRPLRAALPAGYFARAPELLRLQLPRCGAVQVQLLVAKDQTLPPLSWIRLRAADTRAAGWLSAQLDAGRALFSTVEVGGEIEVEFYLQGVQGQSLLARGLAPKRVDETASMPVRIEECGPIVRGRLLDADGKPVAGKQLWVWKQTSHGGGLVQPVTDADGRFCFVPKDRGEQHEELRMVVRTADHRRSIEPLPGAFAKLAAEQRGLVDLGNLRLEPEPEMLRGRAVDTEGKPLAAVTLVVASSREADVLDSVSHRVNTDADGNFVVREFDPQAKALSLSIESEGWLLVSEPKVRAGDTDAKVVAARAGSLALQLRAPLAAVDLLRCRLRRHDDAGPLIERGPRRGIVAFTKLLPGTYDLSLRLLDREVLQLQDLVVKAGSAADDPRLVDVDWRAHVTLVTVRIGDAAGAPLAGRLHLYGAKSGSFATSVACDGDGRAAIPFVDGLSLLATEPLHRSQEITASPQPVEVRLQPRARLRLRLPPALQLPDGVEIEFASDLVRRGIGSASMRWQNGEDVVARPDGSGDTTVRLMLRDAQGRQRLLYEQDMKLPADDQQRDLLLEIDASVANAAADLAAELLHRR